ncbi:M4 family metallopeptidase [Umezawaea sp.]|uniref:M4 family metallopeptidase n=1 Tax=Umezawaea sp. TaxID=1955258 RepID=UPI002ED1C864
MRLRRLVAAVCCAAAVPLPAGAAHAAPETPADLALLAARESLLGEHHWYRQTFDGKPVLGGYYARHVDKRTREVTVRDGRIAVEGLASGLPAVAAEQAGAVVDRQVAGERASTELAVLPGARAKLVYAVLSRTDRGSVRTIVDASSGAVITTEDVVKRAEGTGSVFAPNPVVTLQDTTLTDQDDADAAVPTKAYQAVRLSDLDTSGTLSGSYATVVGPADQLAFAENRRFDYPRSDDRFEQVMAYHGVTEAQRYVQRLGFQDLNNEPQDVTTTGFEEDQSYYDPSTDRITFGSGGVDDAEDADIIWHELGHAMQDAQVPGFGLSVDGGAIGEGFGDWWAVIMSVPLHEDSAAAPHACVGDWDAVSYTEEAPHCLRRTDTDLTIADRRGEAHFDGQIWSRALFDVYRALGRDESARVVLEAQFSYSPDTTFAQAAETTAATAGALYGAQAEAEVRAAFTARGIL